MIKEDIVSILNDLIRIKTVAADLEANRYALNLAAGILKIKRIPSKMLYFGGRPVLSWGAPLPTCQILFNSHIDVVPGPDTAFKPNAGDTIISGRGSLDTKSSIAALLTLSTESFQMATKKNICFSLVSDEEIGGESSRMFIESLKNLKWALFLEPTQLKFVNQAKGIMQIQIKAEGKSAHGSKPWEGKNAIEIINSGLTNFLAKQTTPGEETYNTTYNFAKISGGSAINQIPDNCELMVDVRFNPKDEPSEILKTFEYYFKNCAVSILKNESHIQSNPRDPYTQNLLKAAKSQNIRPAFAFDHASSDARHCTNMGIPAIIFGPSGKGQHQDHEWVSVRSLIKIHNTLEQFIHYC